MSTMIEKAKGLLQASSKEVRKRTEQKESEGNIWKRGPMTGEKNLPDSAYVQNFAEEQDWRIFRQIIEERRKRTGQIGWIRFPNGTRIHADNILLICSKCRTKTWGLPESIGSNCLSCNRRNLVDGGMLRPASDQETKNWFVQAEAAWKRFLSEAPERKKRVAEFNRRHFEDMRIR